jgi:hypothetical protein
VGEQNSGRGNRGARDVTAQLRRPVVTPGRSGVPGWRGPAVPPGPPPPLLRATDRDRDSVIDVLQEAYATGRLTDEEHSARLAAVMSARNYAELDPLTADLPGWPTYPDRPAAPRPRDTNGLAVASLICALTQPLTCMLTTIPAIVLGHRARRQIRRNGDAGMGMANWGLLLGWGGLTATVAFILVVIALAVLLTRPV